MWLLDHFSNEMEIFYLFIFLFFGAAFGSFASAIIHRVQIGQSWIVSSKGDAARSACTHCGHTLSVFDLVPIFSWLFQRGKCRYCGADISSFYPLIELAMSFLASVIYFAIGFGISSLLLLVALPFMVSFFFVLCRKKMFSLELCIISVFFVFLACIF